jgi:hypothetical protein
MQRTNIKTLPYPGFPTDMQPQIAVALTLAEGTSLVTESVWSSRYRYVDELKRMGANIQVDDKTAVIEGVEHLTGAPVQATDLRAGAALVIAALAAHGETEITGVHYIERGYEDIIAKLRALGADIRSVEEQEADILTANIHRIVKGQQSITCEDFYDENMAPIDIPLSPILSPQQNAAKFYKDYTRMKNAEKELTRQITIAEGELNYLQSVLDELNWAQTEQELEEIRRELQDTGYVKADSGKKRVKQAKLSPMRFVSTDGYPIYVGRNNRQNDELTFKSARKDDLWLHASKVHGSHVIIACAGVTPPDDTVTQAAQLAAYYAETTGGQNIAVDVTPVKQVKKIPNGKPGMVIYHTYRTVIANPYPDIVVDALNAEKKED